MSYPDIEATLKSYLSGLGRCLTETPINLKDLLAVSGVLRIQRISGEDDFDAKEDYPVVLIQSYALVDSAHPRAARDLAESVRDAMNNILGTYVAATGALMDRCQTVSGPTYVPYTDPAVRIYQTVHRVTTRGI